MEHFYHTVTGFMNHRNTVMLDHVIKDFPQTGTWVELGSWTGRSAAYCVVELVNRGWQGQFYCVDSWIGSPELQQNPDFVNVRDTFLKNVSPVQQYIRTKECASWDAAQDFDDNSVDFCYVDAGHDYESVTKDLQSWWPKIRRGSYFAGDDYTKGYPGLQQAVWDFFKLLNIRVRRMGRCWLVTKP